MRRLARLAVLAVVITLALATVAQSPALARTRKHRHPRPKPRTVEIVDTAALSNDGRTADVVLKVTCGGFDPVNIRVTLEQNAIKGVGNSGTDYRCGAQSQRVVVPVTAASGAFHPGTAVASVRARFQSTNSTRDADSSRGIQLT